MMTLIRFFNDRVKRLNIFDVKLVQGSAMAVMLIIVKLFPQIMELSIWWILAFLVVCSVRPIYLFFVKA